MLPAKYFVIRACVLILAGALLPQLSSFPPTAEVQAALIAALFFSLHFLRRSDVAWMLAGALLFLSAVDRNLGERLDIRYEGDSLLTRVRVVDFPRRDGASMRFDAGAIGDPRLPMRLRLSWFEPPVAVRPGDVWQLEIRLRRPRGPMNPGSVDREALLMVDGIGAVGYVVAGRRNELLDSATATGVERVRQRFVARIDAVLDGDSAAVLAAVAVGARHGLSREQWQRYAATGTSHLMAISGLHIGLAALAAYLTATVLLGCLGVRRNLHDVALMLALAAACAYALVSGLALPARRAALMLLAGTLLLLARREVNGLRVLALVAVIVCISDAGSTLSAGFRLSFTAVLLLLWAAAERVATAADWRVRPLLAVGRLARVQALLFLGLLPITATTFGQLSLAAPAVNLLAIPVFSFITVPLALAGLVMVGPVGDGLIALAGLSIDWLERVIAAAAAHDASHRPVAGFTGPATLMLLLPLAGVLIARGMPARHLAWLGVLLVLLWRPSPPRDGCARIDVLDVGQGLSVAVQTARHALLYDTGPAYRGGGAAADTVVLPFLAYRGIRSLDRVIVSHADLDHAGGLESIAAGLRVRSIVAGEPLLSRDAGSCRDTAAWQWDGVRFFMLHPLDDTPTGNNASCVLLIESGERRVLLTGDIEAGVEADLVRSRSIPPVDVVTVPHHGSRTSSTTPFIRALDADVSVVSAAWGNRWGFPKADVVARWQAAGTRIVNTAEAGAVTIEFCADRDDLQMRRYRAAKARRWHDDGGLDANVTERR